MSTPEEPNPYAAPPPVQVLTSNGRAQLQPVAIALVVTSGLWTVYLLFYTLFQVPLIIDTWQNDPLQVALPQIVGSLLPLPWSVAVLWGAGQMTQMRRYRTARLAAWMALAPVCGPCAFLGIPLGIWAIIVLGRPDVKAAFKD